MTWTTPRPESQRDTRRRSRPSPRFVLMKPGERNICCFFYVSSYLEPPLLHPSCRPLDPPSASPHSPASPASPYFVSRHHPGTSVSDLSLSLFLSRPPGEPPNSTNFVDPAVQWPTTAPRRSNETPSQSLSMGGRSTVQGRGLRSRLDMRTLRLCEPFTCHLWSITPRPPLVRLLCWRTRCTIEYIRD